MNHPIEMIDHVTLVRLVEAGAVRGASIVGQAGGWGVIIQYGKTERTLAAKRGAIRIFRKFETLVGYLRDLGIEQYQVDASHFTPLEANTERRRSDAAERLKFAHEAAAYSSWLTRQVHEAIDDPRPSIPHDEVVKEWEIERAALMNLVEGRGN